MKWLWFGALLFPVVMVSALFVSVPATGADNDGFKARLSGYHEVPSISTNGRGHFKAKVTSMAPLTISYELQYSNLEGGPASAAHIHFAQRGVNGGVLADLCGGTKPACPPAPATVTGTIVAADVLAIPGQGIAAGEIAELLRAMNAGATYVNVHNAIYPSGEIRGQIDD